MIDVPRPKFGQTISTIITLAIFFAALYSIDSKWLANSSSSSRLNFSVCLVID